MSEHTIVKCSVCAREARQDEIKQGKQGDWVHVVDLVMRIGGTRPTEVDVCSTMCLLRWFGVEALDE